MDTLIHHFFHLLSEALPLFVLGAAMGAALEVWLPRAWVERWLSGGQGSVLLATTAGALLPGCAMGTMPLAGGLRARGVPVGTVAAFIMIAPVLSPHTIVLTATLVSLPIAAARVVLSFVVAWALGATLNALQRRLPAPVTAFDPGGECCGVEPEADDCCGK